MISEFIYDWLKDIVVIFIIITLVDLIMPKGSMKRYMNLFIGLIVIFMVISPFLKLTSMDFKQYKSTEVFNSQENTSIDFTKEQTENIEKLYMEKLYSKIKLIIEDNSQHEIDNITIEIERGSENFGEIESINIKLKENLNEDKSGKTEKINIIKVEKIHREDRKVVRNDNESFNELKNIISKELEINKDIIFIYTKT